MKKQFWYFILLLLLCRFVAGTRQEYMLPAIFSDNMVLQQKAQVRFWGKARPGETGDGFYLLGIKTFIRCRHPLTDIGR